MCVACAHHAQSDKIYTKRQTFPLSGVCIFGEITERQREKVSSVGVVQMRCIMTILKIKLDLSRQIQHPEGKQQNEVR